MASPPTPALPPPAEFRAVVTALFVALGGNLLLKFVPSLELAVFARGAAQLASFFTGRPIARIDEGWLLPSPDLSVAVTAACSATDYFLMVAALIAWQLARRGKHPAGAAFTALLLALPLAIFINSLRVVTVTGAHRWLIPLLPDAYGAFLHLLAGAAVFLPSLIALNFLLELHGRSRSLAPARA